MSDFSHVEIDVDEKENNNECTCCKSKTNSIKSYLTKDTIHKVLEKTKILLNTNDYIALDIDKNILPLKDNIPQGEEGARLHLKKDSQESSYYITRYGTPEKFDRPIKKYNKVNPNWNFVEMDDLDIVANRSNCILSTQKLQQHGLEFSDTFETVEKYIQELC